MNTRKRGARAQQKRSTRKTKLKDLAHTNRAGQQVKGGQVKQYIGETEKN
jgi:hypothetical protein